jgi:hypothetical protein
MKTMAVHRLVLEDILYCYPMQPLTFAVEMGLHVMALEVVLQDSFLYFSKARRV